ncbi:c-type heme family protein [Roseimaritima sediminicola]|uniref:c-type heme family protein n=1 Tax=Roseimaritima sediminicola TaxID=2662066 RepID=UPI001F230E88|nr:DUF3365 domain-containing protein [Roseimaritima sediminicola]
MKTRSGVAMFAGIALMILISMTAGSRAEEAAPPSGDPADRAAVAVDSTAKLAAAKDVDEARARARLLAELSNGALQVMHRDFFDEEDAVAIPSASLEDVFHELEIQFDVRTEWLVVNADALNVDHRPSDAFERRAAELLADGAAYAEATEEGRYRFASPVRLASQCLKCHLKRRSSNKDRLAALTLSIPLQPAAGSE